MVKGSTFQDVREAADNVLRILRTYDGTRLFEALSQALSPFGSDHRQVADEALRDGIRDARTIVSNPATPGEVRRAVRHLYDVWFDHLIDVLSPVMRGRAS